MTILTTGLIITLFFYHITSQAAVLMLQQRSRSEVRYERKQS